MSTNKDDIQPHSVEETGEWNKADLHKKLQTALDRNIQLAIENERIKAKPIEPLIDALENLLEEIRFESLGSRLRVDVAEQILSKYKK